MLNEPIGISILALLVVKELFSYLKSRDKGERRTSVDEAIDAALRISIVPILNKQTDILTELKILSSQSREHDIRSQLTLEALSEDSQRIRNNLHNINEKLHGTSQH